MSRRTYTATVSVTVETDDNDPYTSQDFADDLRDKELSEVVPQQVVAVEVTAIP